MTEPGATAGTSSSAGDCIVTTSTGALRGRRTGDVVTFRGVPYAAPPVGARRWAPPAPLEAWSGVRDALEDGPAPWQANVAGGPASKLLTFVYPAQDEDCLTVTVWTPACDDQARPVVVYLHGGAFVTGSGSQPIYAGAALAARGDLVVVTVNYRLGLFGFLRHEAVGATGNEGVADQLAALQWVQREIAAFGGDPGNVTVVGESAGAISIAALLAAGATPFRRAVLQSGAHTKITTVAAAEATAARLLAAGGHLERDTPAAELNALQDQATPRSAGMMYSAVADGTFVPLDPIGAIAAGSARGVDVLIGANTEEMGFFLGLDERLDSLDDAGAVAMLRRRCGDDAERTAALIETYRAARAARGATTSNRDVVLAALGDDDFRVPGLRLAEAQRAAGGRAHVYLFDWPSPIFGGRVRAGHVLEVPFVFGTHRHPNAAAYVGDDPAADALSDAMMDAWAAFARTGDPGWPAYEPTERLTQRFGPICQVESDPLGDERAAWG